MPKIYSNRSFKSETIQADGCEFIQCTFEGTHLLYRGGDPFTFNGGSMDGIEITFEGPARATLDTLRIMHHSGLHGIVEQFISSIRNPGGAVSH